MLFLTAITAQTLLYFHHLLPKNKPLLKVWVHKIGRKKLPINDSSRVYSDHFVNSVGRLQRKDEHPTIKLHTLPTQVIYKPRKPPKERYIAATLSEFEQSSSDEHEVVTISDASINTDITGNDIEALKIEISELKEEACFLKKKH